MDFEQEEYYTVKGFEGIHEFIKVTSAKGERLFEFKNDNGILDNIYQYAESCTKLTPEDVAAWNANDSEGWKIVSSEDNAKTLHKFGLLKHASSHYDNGGVFEIQKKGKSLADYIVSLEPVIITDDCMDIKVFKNPFFTFGGLKPVEDAKYGGPPAKSFSEGDIDFSKVAIEFSEESLRASMSSKGKDCIAIGGESPRYVGVGTTNKEFNMGPDMIPESAGGTMKEEKILPDLEDHFTETGKLTEQGDPIVNFNNMMMSGHYVNRTARELNDSLEHVSFYERTLGKVCNAVKEAYDLEDRPEIEQVCQLIHDNAMNDAGGIFDLNKQVKLYEKIEAEQTAEYAEQSQRLLDVNAELSQTKEQLQNVINKGNETIKDLTTRYHEMCVIHGNHITTGGK